MRFRTMAILTFCAAAQNASAQNAPLVAGPLQCAMGRDYWLQKPKKFEPSRQHWLVVLVHGFQGVGKDALWMRRALARFDDFLVVAPSFVEGFQLLEAKADQQLIGLFAALRQRYRLHDKLFVCGFSAGAQFSHRFTMKHPGLVVGCSAHSGGTWGPTINSNARHIPMTLSCGLDDTARSSIGQTMSRVQAAHRYFDRLASAGFHLKARLWLGVGHATSPATEASIEECYTLATRGMYRGQIVAFGRRVAAIRRGFGEPPTAATRLDIVALVPALFGDPKQKVLRRGAMSGQRRRIHAVVWRAQSLGGQSADGERYWIDDRSENAAGWIVNPPALSRRRDRLRAFLAVTRRRLALGH